MPFYRPPSSPVSIFDNLCTTLQLVNPAQFSRFLLIGDFNVNFYNKEHYFFHIYAIFRIDVLATSHRLASCVIGSGFTAALDLDTHPLRNLIHPRYAERAKPGRGKPLIMHIGFLACFHAISLERSRFSKIATLFVLPL